jgi:hypothetical protein
MLKDARDQLNGILESQNLPQFVINNPALVIQVMSNWFDAYKMWEADDIDFYKIWRDHRMLLRSIGDTDSDYDTLEAKRPSYEDFKAKGWAAPGGNEVPTIKVQGVRYNTGRDGLMKRTDPQKFLAPKPEQGFKLKYAEGLLDVSGTILRNDRPITDQLHVKPKQNDWVCFCPLSNEEDQALLMFMKDKLAQLQIVLGKGDPGLNKIINKYKAITAEVTRLKLAFETDMALGYVAIPNEDGTHSKYKYMVKTSVKYSMNNPDQTLRNKSLMMNDDLAKLLRNNVKRYKSIVGIAIKNEVRISLRKHANPRWPMIAKWTGPTQTVDNRNSLEGDWEVHRRPPQSTAWLTTNERIANTLG